MVPLESLPDAVVLVDSAGRIAGVNARTEALVGYSRAELLGQPVEMLVPLRARAAHEEHRRLYSGAPRVRMMGAAQSLTARHKDGREVPVEIMLSPHEGGGVVAMMRDISRRRELERFRDEYVGYISHDLKNPLSVISLQARMLGRRLVELDLPEERQALEVIAQSAAFIERMVREMLEMSYVESEELRLHTEPVDLPDFLKAVLERTVSTSDRWRVHLEVVDPVAAVLDAGRIERVVVNFVQNALKHAGPETTIRVRLEARGEGATVSVIDRGPGLTEEEAGYVFEKYRRTRSGAKRDGLGLGLYISRKIVEAHGGRIGVESTPGQGARFFFTVPHPVPQRERAPFTASLEPPREDHATRLRGSRVLLVDDEANAVNALAALLGDEGLSISAATGGYEALEVARARPPDAVVLDVEMPGMSGLALLSQLREFLPGLPAVLMTGFQSHHAGIDEARRSSGAAYVAKPVDVDELLRVLGGLLSTREARVCSN